MIPDSVKEAFLLVTGKKTSANVRDIILTECANVDDGTPVYAVCAVIANEREEVEALPIAVMVSPNIRKCITPPLLQGDDGGYSMNYC